MGTDLYANFFQPLTAEQLSRWNGSVGYEYLTDYDLLRAKKQFSDYQEIPHHQYLEVNDKMIDVGFVAYQEITSGPYEWLFKTFFGTYEWDIAILGKRWWTPWIEWHVPMDQFEEFEGTFYMPSCGALSHKDSLKFCLDHVVKLNGDNGRFPIESLDHFHWG